MRAVSMVRRFQQWVRSLGSDLTEKSTRHVYRWRVHQSRESPRLSACGRVVATVEGATSRATPTSCSLVGGACARRGGPRAGCGRPKSSSSANGLLPLGSSGCPRGGTAKSRCQAGTSRPAEGRCLPAGSGRSGPVSWLTATDALRSPRRGYAGDHFTRIAAGRVATEHRFRTSNALSVSETSSC
jgi:hypothetical protein